MTDPQVWISILEQGCFYGLIGLAYLLGLEGTGFFNFAVGSYALVAALMTSWLVSEHGYGVWPALILAVLVAMALAALTELAVVRTIEAKFQHGELPSLVAVAALLFAISQVAGMVFGRVTMPGEPFYSFTPIAVGSAYLTPAVVGVVGVAVVAFAGVSITARTTAFGRALRAVGDNKEASRILGLPVGRVRLIAFAVSGLVAALAGIAYSSQAGVSWDVGLQWALLGFLALVVGGAGSWFGPLVGGILLGFVQEIIELYAGGQDVDYAMLGIALVFFAFWPKGLTSRAVRA